MIDNIEIKPIQNAVDPEDISKEFMHKFKRSTSFDDKIIRIIVNENKVRLKGMVRPWTQKKKT